MIKLFKPDSLVTSKFDLEVILRSNKVIFIIFYKSLYLLTGLADFAQTLVYSLVTSKLAARGSRLAAQNSPTRGSRLEARGSKLAAQN